MTGHACGGNGCPVCLDIGALTALGELVPVLDEDGLQQVRMLLRTPGRWLDHAGVRLAKASALHMCCLALVYRHGLPRDYYEGVGDMPPEVPDDAAELFDDDGSER